MRVTLKPDQKGTKALLEHYGDWSVCVHFPYDKIRRKRYKSVEFIVDEDASLEGLRMPPHKAPVPTPAGPVLVRIHYREAELREAAKAAGGRWQPHKELWRLPYEAAIRLEFENRIIQFAMADERRGL